jgi:hypothetical protein
MVGSSSLVRLVGRLPTRLVGSVGSVGSASSASFVTVGLANRFPGFGSFRFALIIVGFGELGLAKWLVPPPRSVWSAGSPPDWLDLLVPLVPLVLWLSVWLTGSLVLAPPVLL